MGYWVEQGGGSLRRKRKADVDTQHRATTYFTCIVRSAMNRLQANCWTEPPADPVQQSRPQGAMGTSRWLTKLCCNPISSMPSHPKGPAFHERRCR